MDRDGVLAGRIAATHGLTVEPIEELRGLGLVNHTFIVGRGKERCVIRFAVDPLREDELATEAWCLQLASSQGIASPEVHAYGRVDGIPYLVQRFLEHVARDTVSRRYLWETLGKYARRINEFPPARTPLGARCLSGGETTGAERHDREARRHQDELRTQPW